MNASLRILAPVAFLAAVATVVAQTGGPVSHQLQKAPSAIKSSTTRKSETRRPPGYDTDYKVMDRTKIQCSFERLLGYTLGPTTVGADGLFTPSEAEFQSMTCALPGTNPLAQSLVEVADRYFQNGNIHSKQFGLIKLKQNINDNSNVLYITDKQRDDLKKWLSETAAKVESPPK